MRMTPYLSETSITFSIALAQDDLARSLGCGADIFSNLKPALFSILGIIYSFERSKQSTEIPVLPVNGTMNTTRDLLVVLQEYRTCQEDCIPTCYDFAY
mgnify:FL=1